MNAAAVTLRMHAVAAKMLNLITWLVLLNAPFWILGQGIFVSRAQFSLDSLLALLACQFFRRVGFCVIIFSWLCDLLLSTSLTFHFNSPLAFMRTLRYAGTLDPLPYLASPLIIYSLPFLIALLAAWKMTRSKLGTTPVLLSIALLLAMDIVNGSSALSTLSVRLNGANIAGSSFYAMGAAMRSDRTASMLKQVSGGIEEFETLTDGSVVADPDGSILYVIVESMGIHNSQRAQDWLRSQLATKDVLARYRLKAGSLGFHGGTTDGELRRLCGLAGNYRSVDGVAGHDCLPHALRTKGWHTVGFHGFSESMFDRRHWWPTIGLQELYFAEQLAPHLSNRCGAAFKGMCDSDVIHAAVRRASGEATFAYVLTLNSHLPLEPTQISEELAGLCAAERMSDGACTLYARNAIVLRAVATELSGAPTIRTVVIVGDHSPPFADLPSRSQFSSDRVPFYVLTATAPH